MTESLDIRENRFESWEQGQFPLVVEYRKDLSGVSILHLEDKEAVTW